MIKFKFIRDLSIKNKIIAIILFVNLLILSIGFVLIATWDINRIKSDIQSDLVLNAKLIGDYCIVPLTFEDKEQATEALSRLQYIKNIEIGCLYDKNGNLFASYPDTLNKEAFSEFPEQQKNILKDGHFYVHEHVMYQNEIYGTIFLKANSKSLTTNRKNIILILSLLTVVLITLSTILAGWMQAYISLPIIKLKNHFDRIAKNQDFFQRIEKQKNDEIGSLYDGFNNLINQIQNHSLERDRAEKQLKESQEKLDLALLGGDIGIWEWDLKTDRTLWDTNMERLFGLEKGAFKQSYEAFKECLHPDDISLTEKAIQDAFDDVAPYDVIFRAVWKNKEIKFIRAKALISKNEKQDPIKMIGVCTDVTEIKEAEMEIKKHRETLEDLVQKRTQELQKKYEELEEMNELFVGREYRIKELKDKISGLENKE